MTTTNGADAIAQQLADLSARVEGLAIAQQTLAASSAQVSQSAAALIEALTRRVSALEARLVLIEALFDELETEQDIEAVRERADEPASSWEEILEREGKRIGNDDDNGGDDGNGNS